MISACLSDMLLIFVATLICRLHLRLKTSTPFRATHVSIYSSNFTDTLFVHIECFKMGGIKLLLTASSSSNWILLRLLWHSIYIFRLEVFFLPCGLVEFLSAVMKLKRWFNGLDIQFKFCMHNPEVVLLLAWVTRILFVWWNKIGLLYLHILSKFCKQFFIQFHLHSQALAVD